MRIAIAALLLGSRLAGAQTPPKILSAHPGQGATDIALFSDRMIQVDFDQAMDKQSVMDALSVGPGDIHLKWDRNYLYKWVDAKTLRLGSSPNIYRGADEVRDHPFAAGTTYTVTVAKTARSLSGTPMDADHSWTFTSAPARVDTGSIRGILRGIYLDKFKLDLPYPTYAPPGKLSYWTSTAYVDGKQYRIFLLPDGTPLYTLPDQGPYRIPKGTYRIALVAVDHGNSNISQIMTTALPAALEGINSNHKRWADSLKLAQPILQYTTTPFLAPFSQLANPADRTSVRAWLSGQGTDPAAFDMVVVLDIDPAKPRGGFCCTSNDFAFQGFFFLAETGTLDLTTIASAGRTFIESLVLSAYNHELGHWHGWEHSWSNTANPPWDKTFITHPALYGWTDTDGDGVPEILDSTPYGRGSTAIATGKGTSGPSRSLLRRAWSTGVYDALGRK